MKTKHCSVQKCKAEIFARGWCQRHYTRWYRHGDLTKVKMPPGSPPGWEAKTTPKASKSSSIADIHWAAGFLEGEGSFIKNPNNQTISVAQVQLEPLTRLQAFFGGNIGFHKPRQPRAQSQHYWRVCGSRVRGLMMTLYILMSPRRQTQIKKALCRS